jgi:hypothetical protein
MKKHVLKFDQFGGLTVDAIGFKGKSCAETTAKLVRGIGAKTTTEKKKSEYHMTSGVALDTVGRF